MAPEAGPAEEVTRGQAVEATLWNTVARLRARGWHISLREIQRAQDVIAYLFARLERAPTDDELHRHLRPILCGRESKLAPFSEAFQGSISDAPPADHGRVPPPAAPALALRPRRRGRARSPRRCRDLPSEPGSPLEPQHPRRRWPARVTDDLGLDRCGRRVRGSGVGPAVAGDAQAVPAATCAPRSRARSGAPLGDRSSARHRRVRADRAEPADPSP